MEGLCQTTEFSPYKLMFGRRPKLHVYLAFGLPLKDREEISHSQYVRTLKSNLKENFKIATEHA